jgi:serine/arginine repetitive matrix protein 2
MSYNTSHALLSSPDPLNDSSTFSSPLKSHTSNIRRSLPLQGSSPRKQTFQLDVGDQLSPQKIRVTVEAEHSEDHVNNGRRTSSGRNLPSPSPYRTPNIRQSVRTTTTTIPVKGLSDSEEDLSDSASEKPTRGRSRPRKSQSTPIPAKSHNRVLTPAAKPSPRRRRTLGHLVDGDDSEDWDFTIGAGVEVGRGKGRSRSRSIKGATQNKSTPAKKQISSPDKTILTTTSRKGRGRRKTLTPEEIIIHEDGIGFLPDIGVSGEEAELATRGVLMERDMNLVPTPSANFTNYITRDIEDDGPDVLYEKFSLAEKTPGKAERSTSSIGSGITRTSIGSQADVVANSTKLPLHPPLNSASNGKGRDSNGYANDQADENEADEIQEFDTILESEGFSMISVDSVPSLREHLSSPLGLNQSALQSETAASNREASLPKNDNIASYEDSFSSIAPEILEAATPRKKSSQTLLRAVLSVNVPEEEDSFSSIPPEILEAATPGKQRLNNTLLSVKPKHSNLHDDSFSGIAPSILEAATPAKHAQIKVPESIAEPQPREEHKSVAKPAIVSSFQVSGTETRGLTSSGLLTPNETPSPTEMVTQQIQNLDNCEGKAHAEPEPCNLALPEGSSAIDSHFNSSPPFVAPRRFTHSEHTRQSQAGRANHMETPSIVFSSPALPPLIQHILLDRTQGSSKLNPGESPKQSLSPIVRAGRVLQDIAMSSTSRCRTQSLGSPFKSPGATRNCVVAPLDYFGTSSGIEKPQKPPESSEGNGSDLFISFSDDTRKKLPRSMMLGKGLARNQNFDAIINPNASAQGDDPFHSGIQSTRSHSPEERKEYTLELPNHKSKPNIELVREEQEFHDSLRSEDAMSWQAESTTTLPTSSTDAYRTRNGNTVEDRELFQQRRETEWARERAAVSSQIESASPSKVIVIESDEERDPVNLSGKVDDAEEDIWQAEARLSSSMLEEQSSKAQLRQEPSEKPRRSKIPSPWRKNTKGLVYSDDLSQLSSPQPPEEDVKLPLYKQIKPKTKPTQITVRKRVSAYEAAEDGEDLPESSIMWHIPQKSNFTPRPRNSGNLDLSALLASSPFKRPQITPQKSGTLVLETSCDNILKSADVETSATSSSTPFEVGPQDYSEESQSADIILQDDSSVEPNNTSYEESELLSDPSKTGAAVLCPQHTNTNSPSPQKSCLRTPTSNSPTKSVTFVSPIASSSPLSATTWSKAHWRLLHGIYDDFKSRPLPDPNADSKNDIINHMKDVGITEPSKYLGKTIQARGAKLMLKQWHLDIVQEFRDEVPGWDEGVIAKRLFAIIAGEELRRQGKRVE